MPPRRFLYVLLAASATVAVAGAVVARRHRDSVEPEGPFGRDLVATGYVEEIRAVPGGCVSRIAVCTWRSLSPGFPLPERPQRNDRYAVLGTEEDCRALLVARDIAEGHIVFRIGESASRWYFMESPEPGLGCEGFMDDWAPGPMRRVL